MRDGVRLATDIYVPSENGMTPSPGRFPVLLLRTPYGKASWADVQIPPAAIGAVGTIDNRTANANGYILVIQDVRGTFGSEGGLKPMLNEGSDGYDTVAWLIKQPWSDGRVGTIGPSYLGGVQILLAVERPPGLVAGFAQVAATGQFRNEWVYMDGALVLTTAGRWTSGRVADIGPRLPSADRDLLKADLAALGMPAVDMSSVTGDVFEKLKWTLPLRDMPIVRRMPWWSEWLSNRDNPQYFRNNDTTNRLQNISAPFLHLGGWYDLFLRNTYEHYKSITTGAKDASVRDKQRLVIGPWSHGSCDGCETNADVDSRAMQLAWMDLWFKGKKHPFFDHPVVLYVMGENRWRAEESWPLAGTQSTRYYLHSQGGGNSANGNGTLSASPPTQEPPDRFTYDPRNPAPTLGGVGLAGSRAEQNAAETRSDVLVFTSPELTEDVEVTGEVNATLYAASSARDTDWWVKFVDVAPNGKAYILSTGLVRARYRSSRTEPQPLTPGKIEKYAVNMWATSNVFNKGHRIRLEVTSSNFPYADRNPNAFVDLSRATEKDFVIASQTIYHDAEHPSHVELPIIPQTRARQWIDTPFPLVAKVPVPR
jgi:putative CocE/NonD family hydrolase